MTFSLFDVALISLLILFVVSGMWSGFIHGIGSLIGVIVGAFVASHYSDQILSAIAGFTGINVGAWGKWVGFLIVFVLVSRLIGIIFLLFEKVFNIVVRLPFIGSINHVLGGALGAAEGALIIGLSLAYARQVPVAELSANIAQSKIAELLLRASSILLPLVPEALKKAAGL